MSIRDLPYHDLSLTGGLRTNFTPRPNAGQHLTLAKNVDTYDEFNSLGKVPGSTRVSDQHAGAVRSLNYFEYSALTGVRTREVLSLDSTGVLRRINADKSLTTLTTGLVGEPLAAVTLLDRIHLTSRNQNALTTGGIKYDGGNVRTWGIVAPGSRIVVKESIDSADDWTGSSDATKSTDASVKQDTVASVAVAKTGTSSTEAFIDRSGLSLDISDGGNLLFVWLFIPAGALQKLATSGTAVQVRYGSTTLTNSHSHNFSVGELIQGWNLLSWDRTSPGASSGSGATLSAIQTIRLRLVFSSSAQTQSGFRWDRFYGTDKGQPSAADGGSGIIAAGAYRYRVTYLTENGLESNAGPASASVTIGANRDIAVSAIPVSQDAQVIARRLYRDLNLDSVYRFVDQIDNNVDTTYNDNIPAASLGGSQPPLAGDSAFDNSPPEPFVDVDSFNNRAFGISARDRFALIPSNIGQPEGFAVIDQLIFEEELVGVEGHSQGLLIYATDKIFLLTGQGTSDSPFFVVETTNQSGANGFRAKARVKGTNITVREAEAFFIGDPTNPWHINWDVMDQFQALDDAGLQNMHVIHDRSRFRVVFFGKTSNLYDRVLFYQYGTTGAQQITGDGPGTDPQDLRLGSWRTLELPSSIDPQCSEMVERSADRQELWAGGGDGYVYWLQDPSATNWSEQLTTSPINSQIRFASVRLGRDAGGRGEPRALELSYVASSETVWVVTVSLQNEAESDVIASTSFNVTLPVGSKSILVPIKQIGARGYWAEVTLENATAGGTGRFRNVTLYYIPRADFAGIRSAA